MIKIAYDTNLLAYLTGVAKTDLDAGKIAAAFDLDLRLAKTAVRVVPTQALGELYNVTRRFFDDRADALRIVSACEDQFAIASASTGSFTRAFQLATDHRLQVWDALVIVTASEAGCELLLSEDMQSGFEWGGVTVANPFASVLHPRLAQVLRS